MYSYTPYAVHLVNIEDAVDLGIAMRYRQLAGYMPLPANTGRAVEYKHCNGTCFPSIGGNGDEALAWRFFSRSAPLSRWLGWFQSPWAGSWLAEAAQWVA